MSLIAELQVDTSPVNGDRMYSLAQVREISTRLVELVPDRYWLAVRELGHLVEYALLDFHMGDEGVTYVGCIMHGVGFADGLREMRHTYFPGGAEGEDRYVFYLPMSAMRKAFDILEEYFDGTGQSSGQ